QLVMRGGTYPESHVKDRISGADRVVGSTQVVSVSASPNWAESSTHVTFPSGRTNMAACGVTGSSARKWPVGGIQPQHSENDRPSYSAYASGTHRETSHSIQGESL